MNESSRIYQLKAENSRKINMHQMMNEIKSNLPEEKKKENRSDPVLEVITENKIFIVNN